MKAQPRIPWHDTLWAHHSFASFLPQKLDQVVSEYLNSTPWKLQIGLRKLKHEAPEVMTGEQLCLYNSMDCRLTIKLWEAIQTDLKLEYHVYSHDLCLSELCVELQRTGVRVDRTRQVQLSKRLLREANSYREEMRAILKNPHFNPGSTRQVTEALYSRLHVKKTRLTPTGLPDTSKATIEALRGEDSEVGRFATLLSKRREARKSQSTYFALTKKVKNVEYDLVYDSGTGPNRAHFDWGPREERGSLTSGGGHTVSGRLASRIQSAPKYNPANTPDRFREIFVPSPGHSFVYFDVRQGEPRVAAFLSGDPERIKATQSDIHAYNAKLMFPDVAAKGWLDGKLMKDPQFGKPCRDLAKNMGLAIDYFAEPERVWGYLNTNRFGSDGKALYGLMSLQSVTAIISKIRFAFRHYVKFVNRNLEDVRQRGWMRSPVLGRLRHLGKWAPITEVANYPIQSCLGDVMNLRTLALQGYPRFKTWAAANPEICLKAGLNPDSSCWPRLPAGVRIVIQHHDSCTYDAPAGQAQKVLDMLGQLWGARVALPGGDLILPIDTKVGGRWSEL